MVRRVTDIDYSNSCLFKVCFSLQNPSVCDSTLSPEKERDGLLTIPEVEGNNNNDVKHRGADLSNKRKQHSRRLSKCKCTAAVLFVLSYLCLTLLSCSMSHHYNTTQLLCPFMSVGNYGLVECISHLWYSPRTMGCCVWEMNLNQ